jgi:hypothetical protein
LLGGAARRVTFDEIQAQIRLDLFLGNRPALPGKPAISNAPLRRVISRALRAASRARAASIILPAIDLPTLGFSSRYSSNFHVHGSTTGLTSEDTNLSLVWLENLGSGTFTDTIAVKAFSHVITCNRYLLFFEQAFFFHVVV